jgi:hypothetical protein
MKKLFLYAGFMICFIMPLLSHAQKKASAEPINTRTTCSLKATLKAQFIFIAGYPFTNKAFILNP